MHFKHDGQILKQLMYNQCIQLSEYHYSRFAAMIVHPAAAMIVHPDKHISHCAPVPITHCRSE